MKHIMALLVLSAALVGAQSNIAGTWVLDVQGHQVGLGLELDGKRLTGTLVVMGQNVLVEGEFDDSRFTLASAPDEARKVKISGKLKEDGTMEGDLDAGHGAHHWKAERLNPPKPRAY